jgi:hypothetical protein
MNQGEDRFPVQCMPDRAKSPQLKEARLAQLRYVILEG